MEDMWSPFDAYTTPDGQLKPGAEEYFHPPLVSPSGAIGAPVEAESPVLLPAKSTSTNEGSHPTLSKLRDSRGKPALMRGGTISAMGEQTDEQDVVVMPSNPFLSPVIKRRGVQQYDYNRPEEWDFFLDNSSGFGQQEKKPEEPEMPKVVETTPEAQETSDLRKSVPDALKGVLKLTVLEGKDLGKEEYRVKVYLKDTPLAGKAVSHSAKGPNPNFYTTFHLQLAHKQDQRVVLNVVSLVGGHSYAQRTLNVRGLVPHEKKSIWLQLSSSGTSGEIHIAVKWIPHGVLPKLAHDVSLVRAQSRIIVKMNTDHVTAGSTIKGKVKLLVGDPIKYSKGVTVRFLGKEHVSFTTYLDGDVRQITDERSIIKKSAMLASTGGSVKEFTPGFYSWKFSITIPKNTPPSYVARFGYIRYVLMVAVDDGNDLSYSLPVKMSTPIHTKDSPTQDDRVNRVATHRNVSLHIHINKWIHKIGQKISLKLKTENNSTHILGKLQIKVIEKTSIKTHKLKKPVVNKLVLVERTIKAVCNPKDTWQKSFSITLPSSYNQQSITPGMGGHFFTVMHELEFKTAKTAVVHKHKMRVALPIVLLHEDITSD